MANSLSRLWLKNMKRMGKAQQAQGRKLFKSLLTQAVRAVPVQRTQTVKTLKTLKTLKSLKLKNSKVSKRNRPFAKVPSSFLPGVWKMFYFAVPIGAELSPARRMTYWLYLPASSAGAVLNAPRPLVVMLHGCKQTACDFAAATRMNKLAERKDFAVLYPQQSAAADAHRCWHWYKRTTQQGRGDVRLIGQMIVHAQQKHGLDASRTYVAGLSAGAALATLVALHHPELIAAVGLHSAPVFGSSDSAISAYRTMQLGSNSTQAENAAVFASSFPLLLQTYGMPAILIHGERDTVVRRINVEQMFQQFVVINSACITNTEPQRHSFAARTAGRSPCNGYQTVTYYAGRKPQLLSCEIAVLGHAWSGGDPHATFSTREGPDATLMMWNFFARHQRITNVSLTRHKGS